MKKLFIMVALSLTALAGTAYLQSCKKCECQDASNPDCENYDACYGRKPTKADFTLGFSSGPGIRLNGVLDTIIVDSIFYKTRISFSSLISDASVYYWFLGSEVINVKQFERVFFNASYGKYSVTHIIEKTPDKACFPNDDGRDTLKRTFYIKPFYEFPIVGQYKVLFKGESDSIIFSVLPYRFLGQSTEIADYKSEEPYFALSYARAHTEDTIRWRGGASGTLNEVITGGVIAFRDGGNPSYPTSGAIYLTSAHTIKANYWYDNKNHIFEGRRVGK